MTVMVCRPPRRSGVCKNSNRNVTFNTSACESGITLAIEKVVPAKRTPRKRLTKKEVAAGIQHPVPPEGGVIVWLTEVDTAQHTKANRICLKCHQSFNSKGPANRICVSCNEEQRQMSPVAAPTWIGKRHNGKAM